MAHRKRQKFERLMSDSDLEKLPLAYRFFLRYPTDSIGEMYRHVRFSSSRIMQTRSLNTYRDFAPISTIFLDSKNDYE